MKTSNRGYSDEDGDFTHLCNFIMDHPALMRARSTWSLGRIVDWKYNLFPNKREYASFCNENAQLWLDAFGELAGFVISENGGADFAIITLEGYQFLYEEMLHWVLRNWASRAGPGAAAAFSTEITERQAWEAHVLERSGFTCRSAFFTRRFDLRGSLAPRVPLAEGFSIVDMAAHPDYRFQAMLRANAFQGLSDEQAAQNPDLLAFYDYLHQDPIYYPHTDLCVMTPDGRLVSGCEALIDARNAEADIERICTHSDFRKRGFARAVIQECLYRLKEMGMHSAYITGYSPEAIGLYGSLGAVDETRSFVYESARAAPDLPTEQRTFP